MLPTVVGAWNKTGGPQGTYANYNTVVTGHSMGGALAQLAALTLDKLAKKPVSLYTYGAPRIGNDDLATAIASVRGGNHRVTHLNDPVPRQPPGILGFAHAGPEYRTYSSSVHHIF